MGWARDATLLCRWQGVLLHSVHRFGVPSLLVRVQRGLLHPGPWHLRDLAEDVLLVHRGAVPAIAGHWLWLLWCQVLPRHLRGRRAAAHRVSRRHRCCSAVGVGPVVILTVPQSGCSKHRSKVTQSALMI